MFMTMLKSTDTFSQIHGRVFLLCCKGCSEIGFPQAEAEQLQQQLAEENRLAGVLTADYICSPLLLEQQLSSSMPQAENADALLVLSCGVGVQTAAELLEAVPVYAGCDTVALPGFQGLTPTREDCSRCGQCFLNLTGGICPITACSKSLLNGPCGGARNGKCEADPGMDCGWQRILERLKHQDTPAFPHAPVLLHDFTAGDASHI